MQSERINPVALITGAASGLGAATARRLAPHAEGGLILIDANEAGLEAAADAIEHPPERVSTLAFDAADPQRWVQAADFLGAQYGRLDWAVLNIGGESEAELVQWGPSPALETAALCLRKLLPIMRYNAQGGAIVLTASSALLRDAKKGLPPFLRAAADEGAPHSIRVNAVALAGDATPWREAPTFQQLAHERASERAAVDALALLPSRLARFAEAGDIAKPILTLLADGSPTTGATLVVDAGYAI